MVKPNELLAEAIVNFRFQCRLIKWAGFFRQVGLIKKANLIEKNLDKLMAVYEKQRNSMPKVYILDLRIFLN